MKLFSTKSVPQKIKKNRIVQCFVPHGDQFVQEIFCHLIEFDNGRREVVKDYGGIYNLDWDVDFSLMSRVNAWEKGAIIAKAALLKLSTLDRKIEQMVMTEAQDV